MASYSFHQTRRLIWGASGCMGWNRWGVAVADGYHAAFFEHFEHLAAQPFLYPAVDDIREGYRRSVCGRDNVYYRVEADTIEIMAIIGRQDLDEWF